MIVREYPVNDFVSPAVKVTGPCQPISLFGPLNVPKRPTTPTASTVIGTGRLFVTVNEAVRFSPCAGDVLLKERPDTEKFGVTSNELNFLVAPIVEYVPLK